MSKKEDNQILEVKFQSLFHKEARSVFKRFTFLFSICVILFGILLVNQFVDLKTLITENYLDAPIVETETQTEPQEDNTNGLTGGFADVPDEAQARNIFSGDEFYALQETFAADKDTKNIIVPIIDISGTLSFDEWQNLTSSLLNPELGIITIRATQGDSLIDPEFYKNWSFAAAHFPRIGAYHVYDASVSSQNQAQHFIKSVPLAQGNLAPIILVNANVQLQSQSAEVELKKLIQTFSEHYGVRPVLALVGESTKDLYSDFPDEIVWSRNAKFVETTNEKPSAKKFLNRINRIGTLNAINKKTHIGVSLANDSLVNTQTLK